MCRVLVCVCVCVCVCVQCSVFSVGRIFLYVGGLVIEGVAVVILPCFCCFFLFCFSITSMVAKRLSQTTAANFGIASFNIHRTISLVSSSQRFSNNFTETYSAVSSSFSLAMVENVRVITSAIVGGFLVFGGFLVVDGVLVFRGLVFGGVACFCSFLFVFGRSLAVKVRIVWLLLHLWSLLGGVIACDVGLADELVDMSL